MRIPHTQSGHAYPCFCSAERLEAARQAASKAKLPPVYDRHCLTLPAAERERRLAAGTRHTIRLAVRAHAAVCQPCAMTRVAYGFPRAGTAAWAFQVPPGPITVQDLVYGQVTFGHGQIDDQVLLKSDGFPTYHLANVVDDHYMRITHVLRGEVCARRTTCFRWRPGLTVLARASRSPKGPLQEWLSSTPKHLLLYRAFGWEPPQFAHLPLLLNEDRSKLSKRNQDVDVAAYQVCLRWFAKPHWS